MANRIVDNVYIVDTVGAGADFNFKVQSVAFYATDTTGELVVVDNDTIETLTSELVHIRSNQNQPFTFPMFLGGINLKRLRFQTVTAGTAFFYLA